MLNLDDLSSDDKKLTITRCCGKVELRWDTHRVGGLPGSTLCQSIMRRAEPEEGDRSHLKKHRLDYKNLDDTQIGVVK